MRQTIYKWRFFFIPVGIIAVISLVGFVVMQLWNNLLPEILHVQAISFWQALGIFILCKILFGFGGRGMRKRGGMGEKFRNMSPEEKLKFKEHWKNRCNWNRNAQQDSTTWAGKTPGNA